VAAAPAAYRIAFVRAFLHDPVSQQARRRPAAAGARPSTRKPARKPESPARLDQVGDVSQSAAAAACPARCPWPAAVRGPSWLSSGQAAAGLPLDSGLSPTAATCGSPAAASRTAPRPGPAMALSWWATTSCTPAPASPVPYRGRAGFAAAARIAVRTGDLAHAQELSPAARRQRPGPWLPLSALQRDEDREQRAGRQRPAGPAHSLAAISSPGRRPPTRTAAPADQRFEACRILHR